MYLVSLAFIISPLLYVFRRPSIGRPAFRTGGDDGIRTHDPLLAGQVLSQLSYTPIFGVILLSEQSLKIEQQ